MSGLQPAEIFLMQREHVVRDDEVVTNLQLRTGTPKLLFLPPHGTRDSQGPPRAIRSNMATPPQVSQIDRSIVFVFRSVDAFVGWGSGGAGAKRGVFALSHGNAQVVSKGQI